MKASYSKDGERNQHRLDEMPKNRPSKYVTTRCGSVAWFQEPGTFGGHKVKHQGHRMVSGIVRQKIKEEVRQTLCEVIEDLV